MAHMSDLMDIWKVQGHNDPTNSELLHSPLWFIDSQWNYCMDRIGLIYVYQKPVHSDEINRSSLHKAHIHLLSVCYMQLLSSTNWLDRLLNGSQFWIFSLPTGYYTSTYSQSWGNLVSYFVTKLHNIIITFQVTK